MSIPELIGLAVLGLILLGSVTWGLLFLVAAIAEHREGD